MCPEKPKNYEVSDLIDDRSETHLKIGKRNEQFFLLLFNSGPDYHIWEWMVTIVFYSSLHYIKSLLLENYSLRPEEINRHPKISRVMRRLTYEEGFDEDIFEKYEKLKNNSYLARYEVYNRCHRFEDGFLCTLAENSYNTIFATIKNYVFGEIPSYLKDCL